MNDPAAKTGNTCRANQALAVLFLAVQLFQLVLLPVWLLPSGPAWGWLLLLPVLLSNSWWAFIHEAVHGVLFPNKQANRLAGRVNAVLFGAPFDLLRRGHLLHHAASRTKRERSEVYVPERDNRLRRVQENPGRLYERAFGAISGQAGRARRQSRLCR